MNALLSNLKLLLDVLPVEGDLEDPIEIGNAIFPLWGIIGIVLVLVILIVVFIVAASKKKKAARAQFNETAAPAAAPAANEETEN